MEYLHLGRLIAILITVLTVFGSYLYCISSYGFVLGLGLGWLLSGILVFFATILLWGPSLIVACRPDDEGH
jgi:hypothetical protein